MTENAHSDRGTEYIFDIDPGRVVLHAQETREDGGSRGKRVKSRGAKGEGDRFVAYTWRIPNAASMPHGSLANFSQKPEFQTESGRFEGRRHTVTIERRQAEGTTVPQNVFYWVSFLIGVVRKAMGNSNAAVKETLVEPLPLTAVPELQDFWNHLVLLASAQSLNQE